MTPKLALIQRRMDRQTPEKIPAPESHGLGAAIEQMIAEEVERRVGEAVERKQPTRIRQLFNAPEPVTDYRELPPVATTAPKRPITQLVHRDGAGQLLWIETTNGEKTLKLQAVRDGAGRIIAMKEIDESPVLPALARVPRKLYGNDEG